ncbi:restriction endonuclease subunit S, partial [Limnospira sp. PMC 1245.20]|uniref:restriction endonuclease subunit S n=1 Tax=Limnospira sp. PMC 1245.20 TaxID=2981043 RepID=UPI0028E17E95
MSELPKGWVFSSLLGIVNLHDSQRIPLNQKQRAERQGAYPYYGANGQVDSIDGFIFDGNYILLAEDGGYFDHPFKGVAYEVSGRFWVNNHAHILSPCSEIPIRFLFYVLNSLDWMPYVGGSTRLKLTQESMRRVLIPLPPLNEQRRIVAKLDRLFARSL